MMGATMVSMVSVEFGRGGGMSVSVDFGLDEGRDNGVHGVCGVWVAFG